MQARATGGVRQTVHTLVTVLNEPEDMVRECVGRLLAAPEPAPMQQYIWVCDDGHDRSDGPRKRAVVADLRALGAPQPLPSPPNSPRMAATAWHRGSHIPHHRSLEGFL